MRGSFRSTVAALMVCGCITHAAQAQSNILRNGDFEADPEGTVAGGTDVGEVNVITGWRVFAVNGATGTATVKAAAGRNGKGIELVRQAAPGTDAAIDKDDSSISEVIPAEERIYKLTVDARDGGTFGGSSRLFAELQFPGASTSVSRQYDPAADWETFGMTGRSGVEGRLSARFNLPSEFDSSLYLDNARAVDATVGVNRVVNGGFENSASRLLNWRFFDTTGASGSAALSGDAHTGSSAALLNVTTEVAVGDIGLDLEGNRIATIGGESLRFSFAAKNTNAANEFLRLKYTIAGFDSTGAFTGDILNDWVAPSSTAYDTFSIDFDVPPEVAALNIAFRTYDELTTTKGIGSFLIDDVSVSRPLDISAVDLDHDLDVDGNDFLLIQRGLGSTTTAADFAAWKNAFGLSVAPVTAIPEPAGLALAAVGLLLAGRLRRRLA